MPADFYTCSRTIGGTEYTAQFNGISAYLKAVDECYLEGSSNLGVQKLSGYILENVIVEPKGLAPDDFEDLETFNQVMAFGREVMSGCFRTGRDKGERPA